MASPFPGMDPYLEQFWRDVHARLIIYAADQLQAKLPGEGQDVYLRKRDELKQCGVTLVEIDLLRAGKRLLAVPSDRIPDSPPDALPRLRPPRLGARACGTLPRAAPGASADDASWADALLRSQGRR